MRIKTYFSLLGVCFLLLSCTGKRPVEVAGERAVLRKDTVSEVQKKGKDTIKGMSEKVLEMDNHPYKILIPSKYHQSMYQPYIDDN